MKRFFYITLSIFLLAGFLTHLELSGEQQNTGNKTVTGVLKQGIDLGLDYCLNGYFLDMGDDYVFLRADLPSDEYRGYSDASNLYEEVSLELEFAPEDTLYCEALLCECEKWAIVK